MALKLGFTYHFVQPADMKYGRKNVTTGEWNGLIRDLLDNKTDMIVVALSNNLARKHDIDFTYPIFDAGKQPIITHYLGHVTGYQPIRDQYFTDPIYSMQV